MKAGIVGAGIMGQLLALSLIQAGWRVTVFDQEEKNNCSMAAAGLLAPVTELDKNDGIIFKLGIEAINQHWPHIINQLSNSIYFQQLGSLVLSHPKDTSEEDRFIRIISNKIKSNQDIPQDNLYQKLNQNNMIQLEPELQNFHNGYYFPCEGQIDNQSLLTILKQDLIKKGVTWLNTFISDIQSGKVILHYKILHFDCVFDCRGLGAKSVFSDLRSIRGELIWLHAPTLSITRPIRLLHPRYSLYIIPRPHQIYLIGASEIESADDTPISVRTMLELLTAAYYVHSKFSEARIVKTITQRRPTLADHLPRIKYSDGFIAVNGLYRHGFLIAPTLVCDIMNWIQKGTSAIRYELLWRKR